MAISTRTHACLDLATAGFALAFPRLLGASPRLTKIMTAVALGKIGYGLVTRHELGVVKALPMKAHLALDALEGAALCALPTLLDEEESPAVTACTVGLGLVDLAAATLTETRPRAEHDRLAVPQDKLTHAERRMAPPLPTASVADTIKIISQVVLPTVAKGPIIRRPKAVALSEQMELDTLAVKTLQEMRAKYGSGPLLVKMPLRKYAVILEPAHVRRVLDETPEPFATASKEKYAALAHFEPKSSLISQGPERHARRQLNAEVLEARNPTHHFAERFLSTIDEEAGALLDQVQRVGELRWDEFIDAWFCAVRRIVFGDSARDDRHIIDLTAKLRFNANWLIFKPRRTDLRNELHKRIRHYLEQAESGSLASYVAARVRSKRQAPEQQIPQWLFAFDPAAMATFRALALLATHPEQQHRARGEAGSRASERPHRPFLRATVLESLRLWPTTPMILRETTRDIEWENGFMPAGTSVLVFAPFFHRDNGNVPYAHTFHPDVWMEDDPEVRGFPPRVWPFVPFSGGSAHCPAQNLVLMLTSGMLAALVGKRQFQLTDPERLPAERLPGTLDNYTLRFHAEQLSRLPAATAQEAERTT